MDIVWHSGARGDLQKFSDSVRKRIVDAADVLGSRPLGEHSSILSKQGLEIYGLKLKQGELDHRVFFDISDGKVVVLGVMHRDKAYTTESIEEISSRV